MGSEQGYHRAAWGGKAAMGPIRPKGETGRKVVRRQS